MEGFSIEVFQRSDGRWTFSITDERSPEGLRGRLRSRLYGSGIAYVLGGRRGYKSFAKAADAAAEHFAAQMQVMLAQDIKDDFVDSTPRIVRKL